MKKWEDLGLQKFLTLNPNMRLSRFDHSGVCIQGEYAFSAKKNGFNDIQDSFSIRVYFSKGYPNEIPLVTEINKAIPKLPKYHINDDSSFCLGSGIRLKKILSENKDILFFFKRVIEPFLYSISYKLKYDEFPNGELRHGENGLIDDYEQIFSVKGKQSVLTVLSILSCRKRVANKLPCPCGCKKRVGKCSFRFTLNKFRKLATRRWFKTHLAQSFTPIIIEKKKKKLSKIPVDKE